MNESWREVAADIESRIEADIRQDAMGEEVELRHGEEATTTLANRLYAHVGRDVTLILGGDPLRVRLEECAEEWLAGATATGLTIARLCAIDAVVNLPVAVEARPGVARKLGLTSGLRRYADGRYITCRTREGLHMGVLARVGRDFIDVDTPSGCTCINLQAILRVDLRD